MESNAGASGEQAIESAADDEPLMTGAGDGIPYIQAVQDESGNAVLGKDGELTWETKTYDGEWSRPGTSMSNGWYYVESSILEQNVINVEGDVHIILGDGCELAAHDGIYIHDGATLTVYGQSVGASRVFGWGDSETDSAGIGGRMDARGGNLVTHGVNVEGRGKDGGAEYAPEEAGGEPNFYGMLATVLRDFSAYKTVDGKSLLYMENRMPVLEEVRGRIVVFVQNPYALGEHYYGAGGEACGMSWSSNMKAGIDFAEENHFDVDGSTKARHIANHLDDYVKILPLSEEQRKVHAYCDYTRQVTCRPCLVCPCQRQPPSLVRASGHKARGSPRP